MGKVVVDETTLVVVRPGRGGGGGEECHAPMLERSRRCRGEGAASSGEVRRGSPLTVSLHSGSCVRFCLLVPVGETDGHCGVLSGRLPAHKRGVARRSGGAFAEEEEGGHRGGKRCRRPGAEKSARQRVEGGLRPMWQEFAVVAWLEGGGCMVGGRGGGVGAGLPHLCIFDSI